MTKKIAITGANGFIGKALVEALQKEGFMIIALVRKAPIEKSQSIDYQEFILGKSLNQKDFEGIDTIVHLAYYSQNLVKIEADDVNIFSAKELKKLPIKNKIFVSSFAAVPPVGNSYYAKCKIAIEKIFEDQTIIRPALVLGDGGLCARLKKQIKKSRFVPMLDGGNQIMQTIEIEVLVEKIIGIIKEEKKGLFHFANPEKTTYKEVIRLITKQLDKKIFFIPIPVWALRLLIKSLSILPNPPITEDNLEGLLASKYVENVD
jgi:NAD dependent epimerase/dehydratase family enzyme